MSTTAPRSVRNAPLDPPRPDVRAELVDHGGPRVAFLVPGAGVLLTCRRGAVVDLGDRR